MLACAGVAVVTGAVFPGMSGGVETGTIVDGDVDVAGDECMLVPVGTSRGARVGVAGDSSDGEEEGVMTATMRGSCWRPSTVVTWASGPAGVTAITRSRSAVSASNFFS